VYALGQGVPQDYVLAHMWLDLAASQLTGEEREDAVTNGDLAVNQLTPDALHEAQRLVRERDAAGVLWTQWTPFVNFGERTELCRRLRTYPDLCGYGLENLKSCDP